MLPADPIELLQHVMIEGGERAFGTVPLMLARVIQERLWADRRDQHGEPFRSFEAFVTALLPEGLESSIDDLIAFCRKHEDVQRLIKGEVDPSATPSEAGAKGGRGRKADSNATGFVGRGSTYALKRLKRDRPDLFQRVVAGELSAHAAAIEAGFRRRTFSVPDDVPAAAHAIRRHFGETDAAAIGRLIIEAEP
jgi:hypothetical protein